MKNNFRFIYLLIFVFIIINFIFSILYRSENNLVIIKEIRIPRVLATYFVGAGLSLCGCVLQSIFLNPLCESYTLGISSAAALGVIIGNLVNLPFKRFTLSFFGSFFGFAVIFFINRIFRRTISTSFILSGIVLNYLLSSLIIILTIFFDPYRLNFILLWLLGGFSIIDSKVIYFSIIVITICSIIILLQSKKLDVLILGKEKALTLGVDENNLKQILLINVILISSVCVSISGIISFIGIIVPNVVKFFFPFRHKTWFVFSILFGALFVSFADNISKNIIYPIETPISIFTGIIGSIFFILYLISQK